MYTPRRKLPKEFDYDLIVIGTGSGGGVAAEIANRAGKKVAVIEKEKLGGECPNFGCVPTKALLEAAHIYEETRRGPEFGIHASKVTVNYSTVKKWKDDAVERTGTSEGIAFYEAEGIAVIKGDAHFLSPWVVSVNGKHYSAKRFLIATGTRSVVPPIPGLKEAGFMSHREATELTSAPTSIFVLGGGAIGCEFTQLFNTFGSKVHLADMTPRLVPLEDAEVGELLEALFTSRGISVHTGARVTRVTKKGKQKIVHFVQGEQTHQVAVDEIMVSAGMAPNTDIGLENAGVNYEKSGITVNKHMRTSAPHIYAAGDVVGPYRFTHTATYQSRIAAHNMLHPKKQRNADYRAIPRCIFVEPEIACVGATEQQLKDKGVAYQTAGAPINVIGRSNTSGFDSGFVKVIASRNGTLLGASIVSPRAGEIIHELTIAIQHGLSAQDVTDTIHAFPTWSETVRLACQKIDSK